MTNHHEPEDHMTTEPDREPIRQLLVHPAVWPHLTAWLEARRIVVARLPQGALEDDLPTYVMRPADMAPTATEETR
ncbi:hypothetical protein [Streptomyces sp. XC 2026]|uniref:hypothetical protein n=1 Tax=Streptomyces sp. XC 2026 TaxID=2782004 RepID=UPI0019044A3B|nr:hypothetical protein [Streptomyces sp. XC 2026]QQN79752.1 hypothetical protein IPZ77_21745 [Streptomyces sp. XC 2026]QQN80640.1 hypothetical protein IPZ77_26910 [Streptomyces sp. XC 2026]